MHDPLERGDERHLIGAPRNVRDVQGGPHVVSVHLVQEPVRVIGGHDVLALPRLHVLDAEAQPVLGRVGGQLPDPGHQPRPVTLRVVVGHRRMARVHDHQARPEPRGHRDRIMQGRHRRRAHRVEARGRVEVPTHRVQGQQHAQLARPGGDRGGVAPHLGQVVVPQLDAVVAELVRGREDLLGRVDPHQRRAQQHPTPPLDRREIARAGPAGRGSSSRGRGGASGARCRRSSEARPRPGTSSSTRGRAAG